MSKGFEKYLSSYLNKYPNSVIKEAMAYSLDGGKRFRPRVIFAICKGFGINEKYAYPCACALEFIQTYSLIHDDLPEMDNDDYRRNKLSTHKKYGTGIGLLTGDALLTHAFSVLSDPKNGYDGELSKKLIYDLSQYSGLKGMIYGQLLDVTTSSKKLDKDLLFEIQDNKTSGLFKYCTLSAMHLAHIDKRKYFEKLGSKIGVIFQNQDDLFDVIKTEKEMGKSLSDYRNDKLTALKFSNIQELEIHIDNLFKDLDLYLNKAPFDPTELKNLLYSMKNR